MTHWQESLIKETSTAAARLLLSACSVIIISAVKSLLSPPTFVYVDLTVCCKIHGPGPCSSMHYSKTHRKLASKDAFSVLSTAEHF